MSTPGVANLHRAFTPQVRGLEAKKLRLVGYLRVSTDRQAESGHGIEVQERAIRSWAKARGHRLVAMTRDEGQSGSNGIDTRIGLGDALELIRIGKADGLVVYRLDRLARDLVLQEQLLAELRRSSAQLFSTADGENAYLADDDADPSRKLIRQILGAVSEYERSLIRMRMQAGKRRKQLLGLKANGSYAFGTQPHGQGRDRDAAPRPDEQLTIKRMRDLRQAGQSYREIASALDAEGLRPRRATSWSAATVRNILAR